MPLLLSARRTGLERTSLEWRRLRQIRSLPRPLPVLHGADALYPPEALGEIAQGGEAQDFGDEGEGVVRLPQEEPALLVK